MVLRVDVSWLDAVDADDFRAATIVDGDRLIRPLEDAVGAGVRRLERHLVAIVADEDKVCVEVGWNSCWLVPVHGSGHRDQVSHLLSKTVEMVSRIWSCSPNNKVSRNRERGTVH